MNSIGSILAQLKGVKPTSHNQWEAFCPCHEDPPDGHNPSLGINCASNGKILLSCRGGCDIKDVLAAIDLTYADLFPDPPADHSPQTNMVYEYQFADGRPYTRTVKVAPKGFYQQRYEPRSNGDSWVNGLNGLKPILYRLPELLAADPMLLVFITKGEKDSDRLASEQLISTTNPGGAGKWRLEYGKYLEGRQVAVLPDNDKPGGLLPET